jgi:hypothetical protein
MGLLRWALLGATGYVTYLFAKRKGEPGPRKELDGLCAIFATREGADLAVEHLVQEYGIDSAFIYVEPLAGENSAGVEASGGDAASEAPGHGTRPDAPLHGAIQVTVPVRHERVAALTEALCAVGAQKVEVF